MDAQAYASPARGAIEYDVVLTANGVSGRALCELATDFERYVLVEPRLAAGRWLDPGSPHQGARACVEGSIPFSVPIVERVIGHPHGIATLEAYNVPNGFRYRLETARASGVLQTSFWEHDDVCEIRVWGWIVAAHPLGRIALAPLRPLLAQLADAAVRRGVERAVQGLRPDDPHPA